MSQISKLNNNVNPPGDLVTLTGDTGGAVSPTGNNIDILGGSAIDTVGNPGASSITVSVEDNPTIPGTQQMTVPTGTTAQEPVAGDGMIRFDSDTEHPRVTLPNSGGTPGWVNMGTQYSGGSYNFLSRVTGGATLEILGSDFKNSSYPAAHTNIYCTLTQPNAVPGYTWIQVSSDNGATWASANYFATAYAMRASPVINTQTTHAPITDTYTGQGADWAWTGVVTLVFSHQFPTRIISVGGYRDTFGGVIVPTQSWGRIGNTTVNAVRFGSTAGNLAFSLADTYGANIII